MVKTFKDGSVLIKIYCGVDILNFPIYHTTILTPTKLKYAKNKKTIQS